MLRWMLIAVCRDARDLTLIAITILLLPFFFIDFLEYSVQIFQRSESHFFVCGFSVSIGILFFFSVV